MTEEEKRTQAWIGDAVLALYARKWILAETSIAPKERAEAFIRMTSNKFLSAIGEPTAMEAEIGVIYEADGLEAAFAHIEEKFVPLFKKQQAKTQQPGSYRSKKKKDRARSPSAPFHLCAAVLAKPPYPIKTSRHRSTLGSGRAKSSR